MLIFRYKFVKLIVNLFEFGSDPVTAIQPPITPMYIFTEEEIQNSCCDFLSGDRKVGVRSHRAAAI